MGSIGSRDSNGVFMVLRFEFDRFCLNFGESFRCLMGFDAKIVTGLGWRSRMEVFVVSTKRARGKGIIVFQYIVFWYVNFTVIY